MAAAKRKEKKKLLGSMCRWLEYHRVCWHRIQIASILVQPRKSSSEMGGLNLEFSRVGHACSIESRCGAHDHPQLGGAHKLNSTRCGAHYHSTTTPSGERDGLISPAHLCLHSFTRRWQSTGRGIHGYNHGGRRRGPTTEEEWAHPLQGGSLNHRAQESRVTSTRKK